jgi:cytochrome c-type biogenesis protein CcmH/NrfG
MTSALIAALTIGVPAAAFALWPLFARRHGPRTFLALPPDEREHLVERKRASLRALRELAFEHEAGHVSDDDHAELRARYEAEAAAVMTALDRLGPAPVAPLPASPAIAGSRSAWRHPGALAVGAIALVVFGAALGAGIVRYTEPDATAGQPPPGSRPLAPVVPPSADAPGAGSAGAGGRALSPEMLQGMLQAARSSLGAGRYGEAIAAYQAVLKREPNNVDAMTHLGLIVAIGGHADTALETFERALAVDPAYPPALLYRGQVLYESKKDVAGAIKSWEQFVAVTPPGEERDRVLQLIAEARKPASSRPR